MDWFGKKEKIRLAELEETQKLLNCTTRMIEHCRKEISKCHKEIQAADTRQYHLTRNRVPMSDSQILKAADLRKLEEDSAEFKKFKEMGEQEVEDIKKVRGGQLRKMKEKLAYLQGKEREQEIQLKTLQN